MKKFSRSQKRLNQGTENQGVRSPFLFIQHKRAADDNCFNRRSTKSITFTLLLFKQSNDFSEKRKKSQLLRMKCKLFRPFFKTKKNKINFFFKLVYKFFCKK